MKCDSIIIKRADKQGGIQGRIVIWEKEHYLR